MPSFLFLPVSLLWIQRLQCSLFVQLHDLLLHPVDLFIALFQNIHPLTVCRKRILQRNILCFQLFKQLLQFGKILFQTALLIPPSMVLFLGSHGESLALLHLFHFGIDHAITYPDPQAVTFTHLCHRTDSFPIRSFHIRVATVQLL